MKMERFFLKIESRRMEKGKLQKQQTKRELMWIYLIKTLTKVLPSDEQAHYLLIKGLVLKMLNNPKLVNT